MTNEECRIVIIPRVAASVLSAEQAMALTNNRAMDILAVLFFVKSL
jgi:hypothetical protein